MDLSRFHNMDSHILLSIVNEQLRIECEDLEDLVGLFDIPRDGLEQKLSSIGYQYDFLSNQFKAK
ncbi:MULTISPECIES: DUF4250 domain-containing protein [unclassified Motilimonas]|uniref:DUF4250 domain-containing protein n=1 Tax=Motilimonas TaxID=1914248 RepID=UPI001E475B03|nr:MULTISPECIES: DUF4250 domain-containing protein [unclassified Motilimonas]MCE0557114.1 DUF4250 domain-containing protein [Motilimonas sp. E26]MDO6524349.1 DUF4250 domain-containing protein [Motilimonas sp. 1_MG-2023]